MKGDMEVTMGKVKGGALVENRDKTPLFRVWNQCLAVNINLA